MKEQLLQIPNELVACHPFAIDMLEAATLHVSDDDSEYIDFQFLFLLTDFECFEGNPKNFLVVNKTNKDQ